MEYKLDLQTQECESCIIPEDTIELILVNVTQNAFDRFIIPKHVRNLVMSGSLEYLQVPDHITCIVCNSMGIKKITLHDGIESIYCDGNDLETIDLPEHILAVHVSENKLKTITCRGTLDRLFCLDASHNQIEDLDIRLPPYTMDYCYLTGNPDIKIKHLGFLFSNDQIYTTIDNDFAKAKLNREYLRGRLWDLCKAGYTYIDLDSLRDDDILNRYDCFV
jgi:hypothetical protein